MAGSAQPRLPYSDLEIFLTGIDADIKQFDGRKSDRVMPSAIARRTGVDVVTIHRWRKQGHIPLFSADKLAIHMGVHPLVIWPTFNLTEEECYA